MAEFIAAIAEALVGLITAFFEALPALLEILFYVVAASVTVIAYGLSPKFRGKKQKAWADKPWRKRLELGIGGVCLASLAALFIWLGWPAPKRDAAAGPVQPVSHGTNEDAKLRITGGSVNGATNDITIAVKRGGARKILETRSLRELGTALRENVTVISPGGPSPEGGHTNAGAGRVGEAAAGELPLETNRTNRARR
jgi:hypothetical protein